MTVATWLQSWFTDVTEEGRAFDARWGTSTCTFDFGNYEPTRPSVVEHALDAVDLGPEGVTFLDIGSGKGRVVMLASQRPWARVIGLEARRTLHRAAEHNLIRFQARQGATSPIVLWHGDVRDHALPGGPLVAFLYNSLPAPALRRFLPRLTARPARLVYVNPQHADEVRVAGWRVCAQHDDPADAFWSWRIFEPG